ncbi:MAG: hypothetical protein KF764_00910 [Labilithrix sp.]|nr:hypothetical protein [Labilithrix sp.]
MNVELMMHAKALAEAAMLAAIAVQPLDPGLSVAELQQVVVGRDGIGAGTFRDVVAMFGAGPTDSRGRLLLASTTVMIALLGDSDVPEEIRPAAALNALGKMFDELENEEGRDATADRSFIHARCSSVPSEQIDRALGLVLCWGQVEQKGGRFCRRGRAWPEYRAHPTAAGFGKLQIGVLAAELLPVVRDVFAKRAGVHVPSEPPAERFGRFLTKQGWTGFAGWWTSTLREMSSLSDDRHPSAICVLCGALLEAALVAISAPAVDAAEWKQKFLANPPDRWKLGELIDQAEASKIFRPEQRALADLLANQRNRIHAGRFHERDRFNPPYTNAHEARSARDNLAILLTAILDWQPIKSLT